ncbi:hypothetical protein O181_031007 [Austropuccinia psidii MF-1]|uniref:Reverse transcriptase Ty1/copia-type domain-containing protein n=1 Tax=Austropuccinia psidii MF-1 TaxID=1389203 RepID=A0A9Q3H4Y5_9BASI|nr:hypothetical protein [Austropuccinia psidii MF-1]
MNDILRAYPRAIVQHDCHLPPMLSTTPTEEVVMMEATAFRSVVGSLAYLVSGSRPDLAFAGNYLARHSITPMVAYWELLDLVVGYLLKTCGHRVVLKPGEFSLNLWGGDLEQFQSGFMLKLRDAPILWGSKNESMVALSTCAMEYTTLFDSTQHLVQAINQLMQLNQEF